MQSVGQTVAGKNGRWEKSPTPLTSANPFPGKPSLGMAAEIGQQRTSPPFPVRAIITYNEPTKHDGRYQYFAA